jgi:hypothetical protein
MSAKTVGIALVIVAFLYLLAVAYHAHRILFDSLETVYIHQPSSDSFFTGVVDASVYDPKELWNPFQASSYNLNSISQVCYAGRFQDLVASYERDLQLRRDDPNAWALKELEGTRTRSAIDYDYLDTEFTDIYFYFHYGMGVATTVSPLLTKYIGGAFLNSGNAIVVRHFVDGREPQTSYLSDIILVSRWQLDEPVRTLMREIVGESQDCTAL